MARARLPALLAALSAAATAEALVEPHRSVAFLPFSNGRAAAAFDVRSGRLNRFWEHPYRFPSAGVETRNFLHDLYPGLRVGAQAKWLAEVAPDTLGYEPGTGVVRVQRSFAGIRVEEWYFSPPDLPQHAVFLVVRATRLSGSDPVDLYALFNFHLGAGSPEPDAAGEHILRDEARDAFYEWGPAGVTFGHAGLQPSAHWSATPRNPWGILNAAGDLPDEGATGAALDDSVCGFQQSLGALDAPATVGWFSVLAADRDAAPKIDAVRAWVARRTPEKLLADVLAEWRAWTTAPPAGATAGEADLARQSQAILRMAQVAEPGRGEGQILASMAPGKWNIAWVRDMAYATVALVRSGHYPEARRALAFQMGAQTGAFLSHVGMPYRISVVRYFGDGTEESDSNADGPNVEFDGFGLFFWSLGEYVRASGDETSLAAWWPDMKTGVADVLVSLQEPSGLIRPDSSIWEVHWNGKQRHFAYTTIAAARGLAAAAESAGRMGDAAAERYSQAAARARDAIVRHLRSAEGILAQATESLASGRNWLDASAVEAFNFGLLDPTGPTATATLAAMRARLVPPGGRGFMRNEGGEWYDSQEWVFVDLRAGHALRLAGQARDADLLLAWNEAQAAENFGEFAELHDRATADYAGETPMAGLGAGAFLLALHDRGLAVEPACGVFADENPLAPDGGSAPDAGDGGAPPASDDRRPVGCGCEGAAGAGWALLPLAGLRRAAASRRR